MPSSAPRLFGLVLSILTLTGAAPGQGDAALFGRWIGLDGESKGDEILFEKGFVTIDGNRIPCAVIEPGVLLIGGAEHGQRVNFGIRDDLLVLAKDGEKERFRRQAAPSGKASGTAKPEVLSGVFGGKTSRFEHPRGWFGFDMPEGWSVYAQGDTGMTLNPGLGRNDSIDAIVTLIWGRLEAADQNRPVGEVITKSVPLIQQALRENGILVGSPDGPVKIYKGKDVPGAVVKFHGQTGQGQRFSIWAGGIVKRDGWIMVGATIVAGKEAAFLPNVKRIFVSLEPRPPERNLKLEALLPGKTFTSSQYGRVTKSAHHAIYAFAPGNSVTRRLMSNIISQPGLPGSSTDSERAGRYEVCGDLLYMFFESGQEVGHLQLQAGQLVGFRIGGAQYR